MAQTLTRTLTDLGALLHLVDPTLPIGGFNHSNGLETFVQQGVVRQSNSRRICANPALQNWIYNDGAYLSLAFDAMCEGILTACANWIGNFPLPKWHAKVVKEFQTRCAIAENFYSL